MSSGIEGLYDSQGVERRFGTKAPEDFGVKVQSYPRLQDAKPDWMLSQADIIKGLQNLDRIPRRKIFADSSWMTKSNQLSIGSCDGWTVADILTILRYERGIRDGWIGSGSYAYSRMNGNPSVDHGSALIDAIEVIQNDGTCSVDTCGPNVWRRSQTTGFDAEAAKHKAAPDATFWVKSWIEYLSALYLRAVGNHVVQCDRTRFANYKGVGPVPVTHGIGNHSMTGIDVEVYKGSLFATIKNHWGLGWGDHGFGIMGEDSISETLSVHGMFVTFSTYEADA